MKKKSAQQARQSAVPASTTHLQPGAGMLRLLSQPEMKQVAGGPSGPSKRGKGH